MAAAASPRGSPSKQEETLLEKEEVVKSFARLQWNDYSRNGFIDADEARVLKGADEKPLEYVLAEEGDARKFAATLIKLLKNVSDSLVQQYALTHIEDILAEDLHKRAQLFSNDGRHFDASPFLRAMEKGDLYCKKTAATILALLFQVLQGDLEGFVSSMSWELSNSRSKAIRALIPPLSVLLRSDEARLAFGAHGGVGYITKLLKLQGSHGQAQLLYELTFCLWALSFQEQLKHDFLSNGTVPVLAEQVAAAPREKVMRVALSALRNLWHGRLDSLSAEMIAANLPKTLENLLERKWSDPELKSDVEYLYEALQNDARDLSTYERYVTEVKSGQLRWGIVHTDKFWRENVKQLEANDFKTLRSLIQLLQSEDEEVVSIACYDIGEFARFYPNGRNVVKLLGAKERVMGLVDSHNPEVSRYALQCVSKIMVQKWEFVTPR